ncbi:MAG: glycosyltransferase family 39 protein [Anaerolineales bacterium]
MTGITNPLSPSTKLSEKTRILFWVSCAIAMGLRLTLALVNRQAYDDHMQVITWILQHHSLPLREDCWECFQPKLYHLTVAGLIQLLGITNAAGQIVAAQLINFVAGGITLLVIWAFLKRIGIEDQKLLVFVFLLTALNPVFIAINSQATNDTFVILFMTLAAYFTFLGLQEERVQQILLAVLFASLAISSKTNAWAGVFAILAALLVKAWLDRARNKRSALFAVLFFLLVFLIACLNPINQYIANIRRYRVPVVVNILTPPFPAFFEKTCLPKSGIVSIQDGIFTFRFVQLLEHPSLVDNMGDCPPYRTSLWTQLYARSYSSRFDDYPPTWSSTTPSVLDLTRLIFVFALLPTVVLALGAFLELVAFIKGLVRKNSFDLQLTSYGLFFFLFWGYIAFIISYSLVYREFPVMKAIFIFPGLLAFNAFFVQGARKIMNWFNRRGWLVWLFQAALFGLLALFVADILLLIVQLM